MVKSLLLVPTVLVVVDIVVCSGIREMQLKKGMRTIWNNVELE
jgi:hypothetical protein